MYVYSIKKRQLYISSYDKYHTTLLLLLLTN